MSNEEVWSEIAGFPDYAVSNYGQIRNVKYDRILAPRPNSYGHSRIVLYREGERYDLYIHHLVAAAFVTDYYPGAQPIWVDQDRGNNHVDNLRFRISGGFTDV